MTEQERAHELTQLRIITRTVIGALGLLFITTAICGYHIERMRYDAKGCERR